MFTNRVPLKRKDTYPFFGTSLKKIGESVTSSAKSVRSFPGKISLFYRSSRQGETTRGQEHSFSTFPWQFLHVVNKGIKSGMMRPSTYRFLEAFLAKVLAK